MKRAYLANGVLAGSLFPDGYIVAIDANTFSYINTLLGADYCYLVINASEIVKVLGCSAPNILYIERFAEQRNTYLSGTPIQYFLTPNEIQDAVNIQSLTLAGLQSIQVNNGNISYPEIDIETIGGINISEPPNFIIDDLQLATCGCNDPLPIPLNYLQLRIVDSGFRIVDSGGYRQYG